MSMMTASAENWHRATNERMREIARLQAQARKDDRREAVIGSVFRWLSMARADFPELGARISDARLREIAAGVADAFLGA